MTIAETYALSSWMAAFVSKTISFSITDTALTAQREAYSRMAYSFTPPHPNGVSSKDSKIGPPQHLLSIRRYHPAGPQPVSGWPAVLYLHGGGFILGDLDSHDFITAALCDSLGAVVIALDYRLAPEHPFPAAFEDSLAAWHGIQADAQRLQVDPQRIALAGDSAGGNLVAALCLSLRDQGGIQPCGQALVYPALTASEKLPSHLEHTNAPLLSLADMFTCWSYYLPAPDTRNDPRAAPLAAVSFAGLPPTFVAVAEYDPLHDEGIYYVRRIEEAGGQVCLHSGRGLVHGCLRAMGACPEVDLLYEAMVAQLRRMLS